MTFIVANNELRKIIIIIFKVVNIIIYFDYSIDVIYCFSESYKAQSTLLKCRRVMQALITYALDELAHAADAAIAPVRMGLLKPTCTSFITVSSNVDAIDVCHTYRIYIYAIISGARQILSQ
jgi:hypothetical protein